MSTVEQLRARTEWATHQVDAIVEAAPVLSAAQQGQLAALLRVTS